MALPSADPGRGYTFVYQIYFLKDKSVAASTTASIGNIVQAFVDATNTNKHAFFSSNSLYLLGKFREHIKMTPIMILLFRIIKGG